MLTVKNSPQKGKHQVEQSIRSGKVSGFYSAFFVVPHTHGTQARITQFCSGG